MRKWTQLVDRYKGRIAFILMLLLVPLAGEPKIQPLTGDLAHFRVSFGSPVFLCFLLWNRRAPFVVCGICTGLAVAAFRVGLDVSFYGMDIAASAPLRSPAFFYYLTYAVCFHLPRSASFTEKALSVAGWSIFAEVCASIAELFAAAHLQGFALLLTLEIVVKLFFIAVFRSFFILSFFFLVQLSRLEARARETLAQKEELLLLVSNLHEEAIHLQKSQQNAEAVTRDCYALYEEMQRGGPSCDAQGLADALLEIAGQVHEIKKDSQRVCAGLCQLIQKRRFEDYMTAQELLNIVLRSNEKYAQAQRKSIALRGRADAALPPLHAYTILSLVNNLVANAVEAVKRRGNIRVDFLRCEENVEIRVADDGEGIAPKRLPRLFTVGYTTKFDAQGNSSGGIGLPYVKHLAEELGGCVEVAAARPGETVFVLRLPLEPLTLR